MLVISGVWWGCGNRRPTVDDSYATAQGGDIAAQHLRFTDPCSNCHENNRPAAVLGVAHGFGRDCRECHEYDTTTVWKRLYFAHSPDPAECMGCHANDRPNTATHPKTGDCQPCHKFPAWLPLRSGS